jgi:integrase
MPVETQNRLSQRKVASLVSAKKRTAVSDGGGLTLTVSSTGYAAWVLRFRLHGEQHEITIGPYPEFSLSQAREERDRLRKIIRQGRDPRRQKTARITAEEMAEAEPGTFQELAELWFKRTQINRLRRPQILHSRMQNWIYPRLGNMDIDAIRPIHVMTCIHQILDAGAPSVANDCRRHIRRILDYGVITELIQINPAAQITADLAGADELPRDRSLSLAEIRKLFRAMAKTANKFVRSDEIAVRLLLVLGVRKMELVAARWSELNPRKTIWTIPKERIKARRKIRPKDFQIPLPPQAVQLFSELKSMADESAWVLPTRSGSKHGHLSSGTLNMVLSNLNVGIDHFVVHDLRRTMRSHLSDIGIPFAVAERCLNHFLPGQGEVYDRADMLDARADALRSWADVLDVLDADGVKAARDFIGGAQVVPIRRSA